ncbi:hypothetical protein ACQR1V_02625 [Bradyrhizobium oligotrophicum]|uniref:hypothetical protein n=1 Tax=Bradyrhizobium oligotrophicum TaxID=44255 RepID=UPI003EBA1266
MSDILHFPGGEREGDAPSAAFNAGEQDPHAQAFRDMEPEVRDMLRMAEITTGLVGEAMLDPFDRDKAGRATLMAELTVKFAAEMCSRYYRRYKGQRCD